MYRGTTPTFRFSLPIEAATISKLDITFRQCGGVELHKELADCTVEGKTLTVTLTEAETLSLRAMTLYPVEIQLRVCVGDTRLASQIFTVPVERILRDGVL